jgi:hypothetical protein
MFSVSIFRFSVGLRLLEAFFLMENGTQPVAHNNLKKSKCHSITEGERESIHTNCRWFDWAAEDDVLLKEFVTLTREYSCFGEEANGQLTSGVLWPCQEVGVPGSRTNEPVQATYEMELVVLTCLLSIFAQRSFNQLA